MDERLKHFTDIELREELRQRKRALAEKKKENRDKWIYWEAEVTHIVNSEKVFTARYRVNGIGLNEEDSKITSRTFFKLMEGQHFKRRNMPKIGDIVILKYRNNPSVKSGQIENSKILKKKEENINE